MMKFLKSKITRTAAFILSVVIVFGVAFNFCSRLIGYTDERRKIYNDNDVFYDSYEFYHELDKINSDLWLIGHMYLRNLDENGKLKGSEHYIKSIKENLQKGGLMDEKGNIIYPETENFEYMVGFGDKIHSNAGIKVVDEINNYAYWIKNSNISMPAYDSYGMSPCDKCLYNNGKGMEYYYAGGGGYAVFDYDTTELDSYIDELGAVIYLNEDGTTPVPSNYISVVYGEYYHSDYYGYEEIIEGEDSRYGYQYPVTEQEEYLSANNYINGYTVYITPNAEYIAEFEERQDKIFNLNMMMTKNILSLIGFVAVALLLMVFVIALSGYDNKNGGFSLNVLDRIWAEIYLVLLVAVPLITIIVVDEAMVSSGYFLSKVSKFVFTLGLSIGIVLAYLIVCQCINTTVKRLKCRKLVRTSLLGKICIKAKDFILSLGQQKNNAFLIRFAIITVFFAIWLFIAFFIIFGLESELGLVVLVLVPIVYIIFNIINFRDISKLGKHIENISNGNYSEVKVDKTSPIYKMTENLNSISDSIETNVEKQLRSERMKIDLVTNVSHDLKTPLTSIISYVDLLAEEEMSEEAKTYVTVLENKTQRLQAIVADLFDLAKATSRTDVNFEKLDLTVLIRQVIGEMEDKLKASGRELRTDITSESAPVYADGKRLYRVLQNLLDNAMKYSLEGTRIYLKLCSENNRFVLSVKNIASYEMTFTADEITERFVRGDKSRTSEGSGLGLSIAKSFTEACRGSFEVKVEDDVFTVIISFDELE